MQKGRQPLTVILIPQAGRRAWTFQMSPNWFILVGLLVAGLVTATVILYQSLLGLQAELAEVEELKRVNRLQQAEIDTMTLRAQETQGRLNALFQLEAQIRELMGQAAVKPSRSGDVEEGALATLGRGGPAAEEKESPSLPTLSAMLPRDVADLLFGKRDTLALHLRQIATYQRATEATIAQAEVTNELLEEQIQTMEDLLAALNQGKAAMIDHIDFMAHLPTGLPISGARVTDRFGWRWSPFGWGRQPHNGIDLAHDYGTPIVTTGAGTVIYAGWRSGGYGYTVIIDHGYGYHTWYAHMSDIHVTAGEQVVRGDLIGWVGSTGLSTGPHVHYEIHLNGVPVDPVRYF